MKMWWVGKIKKPQVGNDIGYKVRKSKTSPELFDISFYNKKWGSTLHDLKITWISKAQKEFIDDYILAHPKREVSFHDYVKNLGHADQGHFIETLIERAYENEAKLTPFIPDWEEKISQYHEKVVRESTNIWAEISSDVFVLERITDDVYGTTTMEGEIVDKDYVEKIIKNKTQKWKTLWQLEATNIRDGFVWAYKQSLRHKHFVFSGELVKEAHRITTKDLDPLVEKWLTYNMGEFRDVQVDMGIFQSPNGKSDYYPPKNPKGAIMKLEEYMNNWDFNIVKLAHMHLFLYSLHPFSNGNKRSTRIIESLAIQTHFDTGHYFKGMWYFYKKNMPTYIKTVRGVLSGKIWLDTWVKYYVDSFHAMARFSLTDLKIQKQSIASKISPIRLKYYDDTDTIINRFYLKHADEFFTAKELNKYLADYDKVYSDNKQIYKRIQKHLKDNLIFKTEEKEGRETLYRVQLERD